MTEVTMTQILDDLRAADERSRAALSAATGLIRLTFTICICRAAWTMESTLRILRCGPAFMKSSETEKLLSSNCRVSASAS